MAESVYMFFPVYTVGARFVFKGVEVPEHSLVVRETIGLASADTLMCETGYRPCCTDPENAWFRDFKYGIVSTRTSSGVYQTRDDGVVRMHYQGGNPDGIFFCQIRVSAGEVQTLYIGVYPNATDNSGSGANGDGKSVNPIRDPSHCSIKPVGWLSLTGIKLLQWVSQVNS